MNFNAIKHGLLEFVVLKTLHAESKQASELIEYLAKTPFVAPKGTIYPLLRKLRKQNLIIQNYEESEEGPARRYYHLTKNGIARLAETERYWRKLKVAVGNMSARQMMKDRDS